MKILISFRKAKKSLSTFPRLSQHTSLYYSTSSYSESVFLRNVWNEQWFNPGALIEFTVATMVVVTFSKFRSFPHRACWWIIQCKAIGLSALHESPALYTSPILWPTMFLVLFIVTVASWFQDRRSSLIVWANLQNKSSPVVFPWSVWSATNSSVSWNALFIPWMTVSTISNVIAFIQSHWKNLTILDFFTELFF